MSDINTIEEAKRFMNMEYDVQFEESDRPGYTLCCPDNTYPQNFNVGDEYKDGHVHFHNDQEVITYVRWVYKIAQEN